MPRRLARRCRPGVESLEGRRLMAAPGPLPTAESLVHVAAAKDAKKEEAKLKNTLVTIVGVLLPGAVAEPGKLKGAVVVAGGVTWQLDLSAVKGLPKYAQTLVGDIVVVFGTSEVTKKGKGELKRKMKVNWMEELKPSGLESADLPDAPRQLVLPPRRPAPGHAHRPGAHGPGARRPGT